jgi:hypothetical protein
MLDAEVERMAAELASSTSALEESQMRSADAASAVADDLRAARCAWRKRCHDGFASALRLSCALNVLEVEVHGREADDMAFGKRRCAAWPSLSPA